MHPQTCGRDRRLALAVARRRLLPRRRLASLQLVLVDLVDGVVIESRLEQLLHASIDCSLAERGRLGDARLELHLQTAVNNHLS